jgi:hypothetical protein
MLRNPEVRDPIPRRHTLINDGLSATSERARKNISQGAAGF